MRGAVFFVFAMRDAGRTLSSQYRPVPSIQGTKRRSRHTKQIQKRVFLYLTTQIGHKHCLLEPVHTNARKHAEQNEVEQTLALPSPVTSDSDFKRFLGMLFSNDPGVRPQTVDF